MKTNKLFILMFAILLLGSVMVSAIESGKTDLDPVARGDCLDLYQSCSDCTYVNLTSVLLPNGTTLNYNTEMIQSDTSYTYNFCSTNELGLYIYSVKGNPSGIIDTAEFSFEVTPSGQSGTANIVFFLFAIVLLYTVTFIGFFSRNIPITILGGMALLFLGVYLIQNGLIIFQDNLTNYIAYVTIVTGAVTSFWAILEQFNVI